MTWLSGRILDGRGDPLRNVLVEIWQCDHNGVYFHSKGGDPAKRDPHFQGFGRFLTGSTGEYLFRTIKPVPYPGRTPHIHFALKAKGREKWTTQCYIKGEELNEKDGIYKELKTQQERDAVTIPFTPMPSSRIGELTARFDIVVGFTPEI
jgi:protocatechuate 3,4-dioxygenase beta subunit